MALLYSGGDVTTDYLYNGKSAHLLHVSQHILPAVKHPPAFFRVQLIDEVCCVVVIAVLIPDRHTVKVLAEAHSRCVWLTLTLAGRHQWEPDRKMSALSKLSTSPQHLFTTQGASSQTPRDGNACLHCSSLQRDAGWKFKVTVIFLPEDQTSLNARLHFLCQMFNIGLWDEVVHVADVNT